MPTGKDRPVLFPLMVAVGDSLSSPVLPPSAGKTSTLALPKFAR